MEGFLPEQLKGNKFADRIVEHDGMRAFAGICGGNRSWETAFITQQDVRELQLAKGAIATGVQILLDVYGIGYDDVFEVILAGAFGNYLDKHSACAIGLIPSSLEDKVRPVGNAAGTGAKVSSAQLLSTDSLPVLPVLLSMRNLLPILALQRYLLIPQLSKERLAVILLLTNILPKEQRRDILLAISVY